MPIGNEKIFWQASPSKIAIVLSPRILVEVLVALALLHPLAIEAHTHLLKFLPIPYQFRSTAPYLPAFLAGMIAFWSFIQQATKKFILTGERLVIRFGVLVRTEDEVELYRVLDAVHTVNLLQRLINVGTVTVTSSDKTGTVVMNSIYSPAKVRNGMRRLVERCRNKRGVEF